MSPAGTASTLLIFTLGPRREQARRRLLPSRLNALELELHRHGLDSALEAGRACGCRLLISTPRSLDLPDDARQVPQRGSGFGARLADALGRVPGDGPLLVVGTDSPGLGAEHLRQALAHLERDPEGVVIGPSPDGGFYLLAAARPLAAELAGVRWCRRDTLKTLLASLSASGRPVVMLEPLRDLDRRSDLELWLSREVRHLAAWRRLAGELRRALAALLRPLSPRIGGRPRPALISSLQVRGPPR